MGRRAHVVDGAAARVPLRPHGGHDAALVHVRPGSKAPSTAPMHTAVIKSRDGLNLVELPVRCRPAAIRTATASPSKPVPMVLLVHGGPWARDGWGFNPHAPVARQPRLRGAQRQLPRLDRLRQEVRQRRQQRVGRQDARRPARRRRIGPSTRRSPTRTRSPSWAAATAATPRSSA